VRASTPTPPTPPNQPPPTQPSPGGTASPLTIKCPTIPPRPSDTTHPEGPEVRFNSPTVSGGRGPYKVQCSPRSGSRFPFGSTTIVCTATDENEQTASCTTTLTVFRVPS
jgi:hypothetical protein